MKIISHRGCENGPNKKIENKPDQINKMLKEGFDVEVDVFSDKLGNLYLGHDTLVHKVGIDFLKRPGLWCHAKDAMALSIMIENNIHCFWHQEDEFTITSQKYIWAYPGKHTSGKNTIMLYPERYEEEDCYKYFGICTDYPYRFLKEKEKKL